MTVNRLKNSRRNLRRLPPKQGRSHTSKKPREIHNNVVVWLSLAVSIIALAISGWQNQLLSRQLSLAGEQNQLLVEQNHAARDEADAQIQSVEQDLWQYEVPRRADLMSILYERADCEQTNVKTPCPLIAELPVRVIAAIELIELDRVHGRTTDLAAVELPNARLAGVDLNHVILTEADLSGANLENANLSNAVLDSSRLISVTMQNANLSEANLERADLHGAILDGALLQNARAWYADMSGVRLFEAKLRGIALAGANLSGAQLDSTDLSNAKLAATQLDGATYNNKTQWPAGFDVGSHALVFRPYSGNQ